MGTIQRILRDVNYGSLYKVPDNMSLQIWFSVTDKVFKYSPEWNRDSAKDKKPPDEPGKLHWRRRCIFQSDDTKRKPDEQSYYVSSNKCWLNPLSPRHYELGKKFNGEVIQNEFSLTFDGNRTHTKFYNFVRAVNLIGWTLIRNPAF